MPIKKRPAKKTPLKGMGGMAKRVPPTEAPSPPLADITPILPFRTPSEKTAARIRGFIKSLPDQVEASKELAWVRNHPAMLRRGQRRGNVDPIEIDINDLKRPPHGPAPSRHAVQMLSHHAQNPVKFFDKDLGEQQKRAQSESGENDDKEELEFLDDLKELEKMIREATKTTRAKPKQELA